MSGHDAKSIDDDNHGGTMSEHDGSATGPLVRSAREVRRFLAGLSPDAVNLLDVRQDWEYREFHLPGAMLVPLGELPDRLHEIDRKKPTVTYCRTGRRSFSAAMILAGQGFSPVVNMAGGIVAWPGAGAIGPVDQGLFLVSPELDPEGVFRLAYAMEKRLGRFYEVQAGIAVDPEVSETFRRLAGFEDKHKHMVLALWRKSGAAVPDQIERDAEESEAAQDMVLEGGLPGEIYLAGRGGGPSNPVEVLELAMAVEAQALDLYSRGARLMESPESREALVRLAGEEKGHLAALSTLLDRMSPNPVS